MDTCRVCGDETNVVVNIRLKAVSVCNDCCLTITKQTVASLKQLDEQQTSRRRVWTEAY